MIPRIVILIAAFFGQVGAQSADFSPFFKELTKQSPSPDEELRIVAKYDGATFSFFRVVETELSENEFNSRLTEPFFRGSRGSDVEALQKSLAQQGDYTSPPTGVFDANTERGIRLWQKKRGLPQTGLVDQATWKSLMKEKARTYDMDVETRDAGVSIVYSVNIRLSVVKGPEQDDGQQHWSARELTEIASYPRNDWPQFLTEALAHGLRSYETFDVGNEKAILLTFDAPRIEGIDMNGRVLHLTSDVYHFLKSSTRFPYRAPKGRDFIILVHEPHWDVRGQFQLVEGLRALTTANPTTQFRFLVEGLASDGSQNIETEPLTSMLSNELNIRRAQVFDLLSNFLIDGPMAYRLLYDPNLPAIAIDDQKELTKSRRRVELPSLSTIYDQLRTTHEKLKDMPDASLAKRVLNSVFESLWIEARRKSPVPGDKHVANLEETSDRFQLLASLLKGLSKDDDLTNERTFFEQTAEAYKSQSGLFQRALNRDGAMSRHIRTHFEATEKRRIPIVFIGNFHTRGVIDRLPNSVGYIVVEPRVYSPSGADDRSRFNDSLENYDRYLRSLEESPEKLPVSPPRRSLPILKKRLDRIAEGARVDTLRTTERPVGSEMQSKLTEAVGRNGDLRGAKIVFGGSGGNRPPPPSDTAIGIVDPGARGGKPTITLLPKKGTEWVALEQTEWLRPDRLQFLERVLLKRGVDGEQKAKRVFFYQDAKSKHVFFSVFDPETNRVFLFESDGRLDGFKMLDLPTTNEEETIHLRLGKQTVERKLNVA